MALSNLFFNYRLSRQWFLYSIVLLFMGSGCTTVSVWENHPKWIYYPSATANGIELSGKSPDLLQHRTNPEIIISYTAGQKIIANSQSPPSTDGCIILKNLDDSLRLLVGLESFLRSSSNSNIYSIKAVISHQYPLYERGSNQYYFRLGLAFKPLDDALFGNNTLRKIDSSWAPLLKGGLAQGDVKHYSSQDTLVNSIYAPLDSFIISDNLEKDVSYFLVGGPSGGGPSGMTALTFIEKCEMPEFVSVLRKSHIPFTIQFIDAKEVRQYKYALPVRILLTPFSVAIDVVTSPVQLVLFLTADYWVPR